MEQNVETLGIVIDALHAALKKHTAQTGQSEVNAEVEKLWAWLDPATIQFPGAYLALGSVTAIGISYNQLPSQRLAAMLILNRVQHEWVKWHTDHLWTDEQRVFIDLLNSSVDLIAKFILDKTSLG